MNYQLIFICIDETRKIKLIEQIKDLKIRSPIYFLEGSIPSNSQQFFTGLVRTPTLFKKELCCLKSHAKALEFAHSENSPDFSVILEDDVSLHLTDFIDIIEHLANYWDDYVKSDNGLISLGWLPSKKYEYFVNVKPCEVLKGRPYKLFNNHQLLGAQSYMVRKKDLDPLIYIFQQPTFRELKHCIIENYCHKLGYDKELKHYYHIDLIFKILFTQFYLFPLIAIEQPVPSLLNHNNDKCYWAVYFENHYDLKEQYWSFTA